MTYTAEPYVIHAVTTTKRVWEATLIPFYKNQFNRVQLRFSALYVTHILSYISHLQPFIHRFTSTVSTYATHIQPTLQSTWSKAQPHLFFAFDKAKYISLNAAAGAANHLKGLANQVGTQRRTYVDPHIRKIWDKVEENATTKTMVIPTPVDISLGEENPESIVSSLATEDAHVFHPAESTPSITEVSLNRASPIPSTGAAPGGVIGVGASSSTSDSPSAGEDSLDDFLRDIGMDTSSSLPPSSSPTSTEPSETEKVAASAVAQEAKTSRQAAIEAKRLAITTRHTKLETDLQSFILTSTSQIIGRLTEMREAKKEELIHMIEGANEGETGFVAGLALTGDKLIKGLDIYLKKCEGRSGTWKRAVENDDDDDDDVPKRTGIAKDEQTRLESVIERVEIKFSDAMEKLQVQVNEWYSSMIKNEHEEVVFFLLCFFLDEWKLKNVFFLTRYIK